jgi:hypothetical protein
MTRPPKEVARKRRAYFEKNKCVIQSSGLYATGMPPRLAAIGRSAPLRHRGGDRRCAALCGGLLDWRVGDLSAHRATP